MSFDKVPHSLSPIHPQKSNPCRLRHTLLIHYSLFAIHSAQRLGLDISPRRWYDKYNQKCTEKAFPASAGGAFSAFWGDWAAPRRPHIPKRGTQRREKPLEPINDERAHAQRSPPDPPPAPEKPRRTRGKSKRTARAKARQRRKLREIYTALLAEEMPIEILPQQIRCYAESQGRTLDTYEVLALAQLLKAAQGDTRAAEFVRDSAGDKPGSAVSVETPGLSDADRRMLENLQKRVGRCAEGRGNRE